MPKPEVKKKGPASRVRLDESLVASLEGELRIDETNLNEVIVSQSDLYYQAAKQLELAVSMRDYIKLEIARETAELDGIIRSEAKADDKKLTESAIHNQIISDAGIVRLNDELLDAQRAVGVWSALKDSFKDRGFMIRALNDRHISQWHDTGLDRSFQSGQRKRGEAIQEATGRERVRRRELRSDD